MDFITGFFSWGEKPKEEIKISKGRDKLSKRFRKSKPKVEEVSVKEKSFKIPEIKKSSDKNE